MTGYTVRLYEGRLAIQWDDEDAAMWEARMAAPVAEKPATGRMERRETRREGTR